MAWHPLGWTPLAFSEIEAFPRAVLAHHYPDVPCHGDFTTMRGDEYGRADLLVGGTPCQSFSIAGLRGGLADDRGNLALEYLRLAARTGVRWLLWENVPGVLSSNGGRDFGTFLAALGEIGYGWAYRVLDAQYFGVAQRRRRVFVVGYLGDWRRAAAVLFERHSLSGHPAPRREAGQDVAQCLTTGTGKRFDPETETLPVAFDWQSGGDMRGLDPKDTAQLQRCQVPAVAFQSSQSGVRVGDARATLDSNNGSRRHNGIIATSAVRRLTPRECERLQGFPDDYTAIPLRGKPADQCPDGPRYKALGNSMAVPVISWLGQRIQNVENIIAGFAGN